MKTRKTLVAFVLLIALNQALGADDGAEAPPDAKAVSGKYYCGDGLGYNITLTLKEDGTYSGQWHGCLGKYGDASGRWTFSAKRIVLTPKSESGSMKNHLKTLGLRKDENGWILFRSGDFYDGTFQKQSSARKPKQ